MSATTEKTGEERPDELDRLLTAYFRSEVPSPWPNAALALSNRRLTQSRLMLAASIAALLVGSWLVTGKHLGPANPSVPIHEGAAKVPMDLRPDSGVRGR